MLQILTPSEEEIMRYIWNKGEIYFRDLMALFPEPKPHQNTVSTFLKILTEKNYLKTEKQGRINLYSPAVDFADYKKFVLKNFLEHYFDNSGNDLLTLLLEENYLKAEDFNRFFEVRTSIIPVSENPEKENPVRDFVDEIIRDKKQKKKDKKKKKKSSK